jgi:antitoxin StbD
MVSRFLPRTVLATSEARNTLTGITAAIRTSGAAAGIVVYGDHRKPEAAIVPYELIELLDPIIEDIVILARVAERAATVQAPSRDLSSVLEDLGL